MSATWTAADRLDKSEFEHDVAYALVNGFAPRPEDVVRLRALYAKRDAYLEATKPTGVAPITKLSDLAANRPDPAQLEATHLGEPEAAPANDDSI